MSAISASTAQAKEGSAIASISAATTAVADFIPKAQFGDLPQEAITQAKLAILDTIGVTLAGVATTTGQAACRVAEDTGAARVATVLGAGMKVDPAMAAFVNGTTGHALDYDDVSWSMIGHPSVAVLPAVLALAEERGLSGRDALLAYIVGFEICGKLGSVMNPRHYEQGFHATGTLGTMGAVAGAARIKGLDSQHVRWALGVAASSASGIRQNFGTDTKPFHAGNAARAGVLATQLAGYGFNADANILDTQWGFFNVFANPGACHPERLVGRLGQPWDIVEPGVLLKMYPSCVSTHTSIDSILKLCNDHDIKPDDVESVDGGVVYLTTKILIHNRPTTGLEGKFSLPYCMARAILNRSVKLSDFTDAAVNRPDAQALLRKVTMRIEPAVSDKWRAGLPRPAIITVKLTNGKSVSQRTDNPSGNAGNVEMDKILAKFRDCAQTLGTEKAKQVEDMVLGLEKLPHIGTLMAALSGPSYKSLGVRY
ncbi:MAG: MmgE/PrpD family protein [Burkholderiales bacterium]|nr:MmgE/PrpD family protein [Burkholderiales bacterium]